MFSALSRMPSMALFSLLYRFSKKTRQRNWGLERCPKGQEHMQRTGVLFPLLTEKPITICKPDWGSRGSEALFLPPQAIGTHVIHRHAGKLLTQIKQKFINLL